MKNFQYDPEVRNLYACGCYAQGSVPALSRCAKHDAYMVVTYNHTMIREVFKYHNVTVIANQLEKQWERLKKNQFHWIMCYPEHNLLYAQNHLQAEAWCKSEMPLLKHMRRLLAPGGYITVVIDMSVFHTFVYQARLQGFTVVVRKPVIYDFEPELLSVKHFHYSSMKANLKLYVDYVDMPERYKVLDCSGIQLDYTMRKAGNNPVCVTTSNRYLFLKIKERLGGEDADQDAKG